VPSLLVTNDFPPKVGGIQSYLWELWRRLPPDEVTVLTTPYAGTEAFDGTQPYRIVRTRQPLLVPTPSLRRRIDALASEVGAKLVVFDPALPVGQLGPSIELPYALVLHGAEVTVPGRLPGTQQLLRRVLRGAAHVIAAGSYPAAEAERAAGQPLPTTIVPPGVATELFHPLDADARTATRQRLGLPADGPLVLGLSRLVPRKGFDVLIRAAARVVRDHPDLHVAIGGRGRDRDRLERIARSTGAPVQFLGRVPFDDLPALYACADVFAMVCRDRWRGLEQEGFGIVFVEAGACGVPTIAGASGGVGAAVDDGSTGLLVDPPESVTAVEAALRTLLDDAELRTKLGAAGRTHAVQAFNYDVLADRLWSSVQALP
jgi:phosphatidylinositol alpha-1,6-mannosyltransferase